MRKFLLTAIIVLVCSPVFADASDSRSVQSALSSTKGATINVSETSTVWSYSFPTKTVPNTDRISVMYQSDVATSDTAIYFEESWRRPTTEGAVDTAYLITKNIDTSVTDALWRMATIDTINMTYGRFRITGQGTNPKTTDLTIKIAK